MHLAFQAENMFVRYQNVTVSGNSFLVVNLLLDTCFLNHWGSQLVGKSLEEVYEKAESNKNRDA